MITERESRFLLIAIVFSFLFGIWFYSIKDVFSPFILSIIIIGFLLPFREHKSIRVLIALVFTISMMWLFYFLQEIVNPFLISFALAYLFDPLVDRLEARRIPRTSSIVIIIAFIVGGLASIGLILIPQFSGEVQALGTSFPSYEEIKRQIRIDWFWILDRFGVDVDRLIQTMETEASTKINELLHHFSQSALGLITSLSSLVTQLINAILIPFITFYFLKDFDRIIASLRAKVPDRHRATGDKIYERINTILSLYIRGKILASLIITLVTWLALAALGVNFSLLIGMTTGLLSLIPYIGFILTLIIGGVLALLNPDPESALLIVIGVISIVNLLDMVIISPKVVGEKLGLHPILLIFSLFVFAKVFGIIGLLIAIPVTAILKVFVMEWYEQNFYRREFLGDDREETKKGDS